MSPPRSAALCLALAMALAALGCTGDPPAKTGAAPADPALPAAPSLDWNGLTIGTSGEPEVLAYLQRMGLDCKTGPSLARESVQTRCSGDLPLGVLPDRVIEGRLRELLISRPETGPINNISTLRKYSIPTDAVKDYDSTVATLTQRFGPPTKGPSTADAAAFERPLARFAVEWRFRDLRIRLTALKAAQGFVSVTEVWDSPGVEESIASRPGASGHGAGRKAQNPHAVLIDENAPAAPAAEAPPAPH